ncbi:MAG: formate/nitrite transporter family protein [Candidatus Adiutrix sp.]|jgi:formate/nitrite transporter|nr:formate/nitrite transporter family protein [Candidatus Adiutrix sp.]
MKNLKTSGECILSVCAIGRGKPELPLSRNLITAFFGGAYIGLGGLLAIKVAASMPLEYWGGLQKLVFGGVFPVGLLLVLVAGADLFTGNCMYMPAAVLHGKTGWRGLMRVWIISYGGNFVGGLVVAFFLGYSTGVMFDVGSDGFMPLAAYSVKLANDKCALAFETAFLRGVGCNWLVCLAIYMALAAEDGVSKAILLWPPVTAFVALGFEHSIANMTFIPLGLLIGSSEIYINSSAQLPALSADLYGLLVANLIPVTLGNIVGGGLFVGMFYYKAAGLKPDVTAVG